MRYFALFFLAFPLYAAAQYGSYEDSLHTFIKKYVDSHEVVKGTDKQKMKFYPVSNHWRVQAIFERTEQSVWFAMPTSGKIKKDFRVYGTLSFVLDGTELKLYIYQSKQLLALPGFADYLFIPFTDITSGVDSYGGGRYIDIKMDDIKEGACTLDFNKAYNPYCAYASGFNCPIPPKENDLPVAVLAGEKNYQGH